MLLQARRPTAQRREEDVCTWKNKCLRSRLSLIMTLNSDKCMLGMCCYTKNVFLTVVGNISDLGILQ